MWHQCPSKVPITQASGFRPRAIGGKVPYGSQIPAFLIEDNGKISLVLDKTILRGLQHVCSLTIPFHLVRGLAVLGEILDVVDHGLRPRVKDGNPDHMNAFKSTGMDCALVAANQLRFAKSLAHLFSAGLRTAMVSISIFAAGLPSTTVTEVRAGLLGWSGTPKNFE